MFRTRPAYSDDFSQSEENALMARLTLHDMYGRFRADMFLSSLVESSMSLNISMKYHLTFL
jgi:hypothetical protein